MPGGFNGFVNGGGFNGGGYSAFWWSATYDESRQAWGWVIERYQGITSEPTYFQFSVRCVQDTTLTLTPKTITFDANGGTVTPTFGTTGTNWILASLPTPTRTDYRFGGWYTAASGGTRVTTSTAFSGNITIYARWIPVLSDSRDGKTYRRVTIGLQTWMAENLNWDGTVDGVTPNTKVGVCYYHNDNNCDKYGRLYNWAAAMNNAPTSSANPSGVQGACPVGWHLPSDAEWTVLENAVGGSSTAGTALKSTTGWNNNDNGTDDYGFAALPGGVAGSGGHYNAGSNGFWWSATEDDASYAWGRFMLYDGEYVDGINYDKSYLFSVRCVQD